MQIDRHLAERRRRQQKRRKYFWSVAGVLAVYFFALGIFIFIVRSPAFRAEHITIEGNSAVATSDIMDLLEASMIRSGNAPSGRNSSMKALIGFDNMLIWPAALPSSTIALIPQLAGVTISKNYFFHSMTVIVTERQPFAVWCAMPPSAAASAPASAGNASGSAGQGIVVLGGGQCFWFDTRGIAFEKTLDTEGGAILVIHDYSQNKVALGEPVLPAILMPNLISIIDALKASGLDVREISLNDLSLQQINVALTNGPTIYFSLRFPADDDIAVLKSLMAKPGFGKLQYVDFTVANRAYYQ